MRIKALREVLVLCFLSCLVLCLQGCGEETKTPLSETQCVESLKEDFCFIAEMTIIEGWHEIHHFMGGNTVVRFSLPENLPPEEWLRILAEKISEVQKRVNFKVVSDVRIEQDRKDTDWHFIEYLPEKKVYEAQVGWD